MPTDPVSLGAGGVAHRSTPMAHTHTQLVPSPNAVSAGRKCPLAEGLPDIALWWRRTQEFPSRV